MRKLIAILCTITLLVGTVSVCGATASDGDQDGDVVTNPWSDLFTTAAPEVTTEVATTVAEETTTMSDNEQWVTASDTWTTDGTWNIWAGNNASARYKGNDTLNDYYVNAITATGDWSVQTNTIVTGLTAGTLYTYTVTIESDKDGAYVGAKDDYSNSSLVYKTLSKGENIITGTFTAAQSDAKMFLEMGNASNSGATFHITGIEVSEYVDNESEGIPSDGKWIGWFEAEGWTSYTINEETFGYTLTDKNIGQNWYSIQTGIDNVKFKSGVDYTCAFTLTADAPKQFKVDNRTNDATVFAEKIAGTWTKNKNGTYSYKYVGTYKNETRASQFINIRIALGYFTGEENYVASSTLNCTVSNFVIIPTDEYVEETTTTSSDETTTVTQAETTTVEQEESTTLAAETTTVIPVTQEPTTVTSTTKEPVIKVAKAKVKKAVKKRVAKKVKISLKRIKGVKKYQIQISKAKKFKKRNILVKKNVKKVKFTIKSKKIKNKKKLYVRARAIKIINGRTYYGKWSKKRKIKIRK